MDVRWRHGLSPDEAMLSIDTDAVLVAVVVHAVLLDPPGISIPLLQAVWLI
jgi:hypothetical protein